LAGEDHLAAEVPAEWADAVERLARDPELGARLAAAGRRRLLTEHSVESLRSALARSLQSLSLHP
ncbi:MAG: glycosyltransferase, partial [Acidobacteria bacterium]|nr:glycosyltransferase [Acidobacteriota bacterium]